MEILTSPANALLKDVRRAISRGTLTEQGWCVAETFHLLEEALRSDCEVKTVLAAESVRSAVQSHVRRLRGVRVIEVADSLFEKIAGTETSQGVIALVRPPAWSLAQLFRGAALVVALDGVQDPGNAGTIIRAAEAFGATGILFLKGTVSPFNAKTLRASAGSVFRVPFVCGIDGDLARAALQQQKLNVYAAVPCGGAAKDVTGVDLTKRCAIIIGSEAHGVSAVLRGGAFDVAIPTVAVESLNAAMAASILLYEARRQRSLKV